MEPHVSLAADHANLVLQGLVQEEVDTELARLSKRSGRAGDDNCKCKFCAFRRFSRPARTREHIAKYHTKCRMFTANLRCAYQWDIVVALFDQQRVLGPLATCAAPAGLLEKSASLLTEWLSLGGESLRILESLNDVEMVRHLAYSGPRYTLRVNSAGLRRGSSQIFYDNQWTKWNPRQQ